MGQLVLSRQVDEVIEIGPDIFVTVVSIRGDKVRLGVAAPKEVSVHRKEVADAIRRENRAAAQVKPEASESSKATTDRMFARAIEEQLRKPAVGVVDGYVPRGAK